jgi:hypothetical protein
MVGSKNTITEVLYLLVKYFYHGDLFFLGKQVFLTNINPVTSKFLDIVHEKQRCFL